MNFSYLCSSWDKASHAYRHQFIITCSFFKRLITLSVQADECSQHVLDFQNKKLQYALNEYPKNYIDKDLKYLLPILDYRFGKGVAKIVSNIPITTTALCLNAPLETKNVTNNKIRRHEKREK